MKISECITHEPHCISPETTLAEAAEDMKLLDVGILPVCEDNEVVGIVTDRDMTVRAVAEGANPKTTTVGEIMTRVVVYCFDDQDVMEAAHLMEKNRVRRLPILDRQQNLIGILSLADLALRTEHREVATRVLTRISDPAIAA